MEGPDFGEIRFQRLLIGEIPDFEESLLGRVLTWEGPNLGTLALILLAQHL